MISEERHYFILEQISANNKVIVSDLSKQLDVSIDTIRRDLKYLEKKGKVVKVHGGAVSPNFHYPYQQQDVYAQSEKIEIARKALSLFKDGMITLLGGGTVMLEFARLVPENLKGIIFTVSPLVALEIAQRSSVEVILLSGVVSRDRYTCTGSTVISQLSEISVDLCMLGTSGISINGGVTDSDWEITQVKKAMVKSAEKTAVLCITEKLESTQKMKVCRLEEIDYLITEKEPKTLQKYANIIKSVL
ncbi:DeoR/GlpR family DNA-binding transcription regulator [Flexithrix dorotheae]|uniref:DeoR/GlpR family DNA-binding transcription regulator n=1 Tax=Flexithrix dorotheae TaxID=70993 RepID=UPI00036858DE|nr:DeoR/GlpR family DNA-binding transcription regulator [Flexithrix dorotheae]